MLHKTPPQPLHLLLTTDDGYARPLLAVLASIVRHLGADRRLIVHLFDFGIQPDNRERIKALAVQGRVTLHWRDSDWKEWMPEAAVKAGVAPAMCARLAAASLLPGVERVIYLDSDLVVRADLGQLWDMTADGSPLWAARDQLFAWFGYSPGLNSTNCALPANTPYFNSGVLVLDLAVWRKEGIEAQLLAYYHQHHASLKHPDQDTLNVVLHDRWHALPAGWNRTPWLETVLCAQDIGIDKMEYDEALANPKLIHYAAPKKPWHRGIATPLTRPFHEVVAGLDLGEWGAATPASFGKKFEDTRNQAWLFVLGLNRRVRLRQAGILPRRGWWANTLWAVLRSPLQASLGAALFLARKAKK